ncbi:hypothetical protein CC86DRAFT_372764 [Ophiobolus disseminans]|uniref:Mid2 domain-containing protein n=1 Tax=Ophiobolus disseminans TaxID=1469910 RepID=A0A6A6ZPI8_9PLEO|nr:hypothetical protein CC86DRAFT_372764 [Ophiobolus disseminans]
MATPTVPTVLFPTDIDTDDDDNDDISSVLPVPPAATSLPVSPPPASTLVPAPASPPAVTPVPGAPSPTTVLDGSSTATPLADSLPSSLSTPTTGANPTSNGDQGLSTGTKAGIGVGVAIAVILMAVGVWMFVRTRRIRRQRKRKTSRDPKSADEENNRGAPGPDVRAYRAPTVPELSNNTGTEKARYYNELASPVVAQEVHGDREFAVELQGDVPSRATEKGESWSPNPPTYNTNDASRVGKTSEVGFADDSPIDDVDEIPDVREQPRMTDKKGGI